MPEAPLSNAKSNKSVSLVEYCLPSWSLLFIAMTFLNTWGSTGIPRVRARRVAFFGPNPLPRFFSSPITWWGRWKMAGCCPLPKVCCFWEWDLAKGSEMPWQCGILFFGGRWNKWLGDGSKFKLKSPWKTACIVNQSAGVAHLFVIIMSLQEGPFFWLSGTWSKSMVSTSIIYL